MRWECGERGERGERGESGECGEEGGCWCWRRGRVRLRETELMLGVRRKDIVFGVFGFDEGMARVVIKMLMGFDWASAVTLSQ